MSAMTPYAAAKNANQILAAAGIEKKLPPQMFYTYANKGYIKPTIVGGKVRIKQEDLLVWLEGYINKNTKQVTVVERVEDDNIDEDQLELFGA